jgi:hypothetical protein
MVMFIVRVTVILLVRVNFRLILAITVRANVSVNISIVLGFQKWLRLCLILVCFRARANIRATFMVIVKGSCWIRTLVMVRFIFWLITVRLKVRSLTSC